MHWIPPPCGAIWAATPVAVRAQCLIVLHSCSKATCSTCWVIVREAGKSLPNAIAEVREAVDFLRYYAGRIERDFSNDSHRPLGPVLCISPWNFPLAIFIGQVSAALAAGNAVLAKPAEQTALMRRRVWTSCAGGCPGGGDTTAAGARRNRRGGPGGEPNGARRAVHGLYQRRSSHCA